MSSPTSFKISEAARIIGVDRGCLYRAIKEGRLTAWRPWSKGDMRIHAMELERYQRNQPASNAAA